MEQQGNREGAVRSARAGGGGGRCRAAAAPAPSPRQRTAKGFENSPPELFDEHLLSLKEDGGLKMKRGQVDRQPQSFKKIFEQFKN
ncbi:hypothetical protein EVAR_27706_1 [Eumeta japonica]|uniref:Uncharacterized protein n=1 Tax=Eumeta variegata TaxID=151549 RepID=A0A4C1WP46_EUMVA|nr:hypothetical protein EVAR_27706_1 [Eumeta japonica]